MYIFNRICYTTFGGLLSTDHEWIPKQTPTSFSNTLRRVLDTDVSRSVALVSTVGGVLEANAKRALTARRCCQATE